MIQLTGRHWEGLVNNQTDCYEMQSALIELASASLISATTSLIDNHQQFVGTRKSCDARRKLHVGSTK